MSELVLDVGAPAHGGSCVARWEGRVVFVRHALPGERVRATITRDPGGSHCFADAVEVLEASPDRVPAPCPHAGPGRCGGCDWQHASAEAQRAMKAQVVIEQFRRLARLEVSVEVEPLPGGLLGWRTRNLYAVAPDGRLGLHRHASHEVEPVASCPLGVAGVGDAAALGETWPGVSGVEVARGSADALTVLTHRPGAGRQARGRRPPDRVEVLHGPAALRHRALGREFTVAAGGFWQVHPAAVDTVAAALLAGVAPQPGERVLDLYAGAGALTAALAEAVGPSGSVLGLESSPVAVADAAANLADLPHASVRRARVSAATLVDDHLFPPDVRSAGSEAGTRGEDVIEGRFDVVVLDPPRAGAGREVMTALLALAVRTVGYVSCDPATLARDVATATTAGWRLASLRAFDAFPMTQHVECLAVLVR